MSGIFSADNPIMQAAMRMVNLIFINLLWLIGCLPLFTITVSTTAMYSATMRCIRYDIGYSWSEFFTSYRKNFKQGALIGLGFLLAAAFLVMDVFILINYHNAGEMFGNAYVFFVVLLMLGTCYATWVAVYLARFRNTIRTTLKNSALLAIRHPLISFCLLALLVLVGVVIFIIPILTFIAPVFGCWMGTYILEPTFRKYMTDEEKDFDDKLFNRKSVTDKRRN